MKLTRPAPQPHHSAFSRANPRHLGQDYGWASGDRVTAAARGTVVSVYAAGGYNGGWGNLVLIDHGHGNVTGYAHLASDTIAARVGQRVEAGTFIGVQGSTGEVTAKHLHFELRVGGAGPDQRVDPAPYFERDLPGTSGGVRVSRQVRADVGTEGHLNGRTQPNLAGAVVQRLASSVVGEFDGFRRGQRVTVDGVTSDIWFRGAYRGNWFAAAGFVTQSIDGLPEL